MRKTHRRNLGPKFSEGARLLWAALIKRDLDMEDVNRALGARRATQLLYGDQRPSIAVAIKLAHAFRVPVEAWASPPTQPFAPPASESQQKVA